MKIIRFKVFLLLSLYAFFVAFSCAARPVIEQPVLKVQPAFTKQYIFIGDSITNGHGNTAFEAYPHQFALSLGADSYKHTEGFVLPSGWLVQNGSRTAVINHGLESQRIQSMLANIETQVGGRLDNAGETVVVLLGGINDIGQGRSAADIQADWAAYGAWCHTHNVKLYIGTMTAVTHPSFDAVRVEANAWLRNNWQAFADKLIDFAGNEALADATNLIYFSADGVHPTALGDLQMALITSYVINGSYQTPTITNSNLSTGFFRRVYNQSLAVSGGDGIITWSYRGGGLPPGITFNPTTGKFEGTPNVNGTYPNIVIRATDATGDFNERTFSIVITRKRQWIQLNTLCAT